MNNKFNFKKVTTAAIMMLLTTTLGASLNASEINSEVEVTTEMSETTTVEVAPVTYGYTTQTLEIDTNAKGLTYGQIFDTMGIEFTDELGQTYYPSEMIGVADGVVDGIESYEHIRNREAAVNWGHKGTYEFRLQFDNSRYYDKTGVKYGYVDFNVTVVQAIESVEESTDETNDTETVTINDDEAKTTVEDKKENNDTATVTDSASSNTEVPSVEDTDINESTIEVSVDNDDKETDTDSIESVDANEVSEDNVNSATKSNYVTQNLNLSIYQGALTYGQIFDIMDIEFTDELGQTYYPSEMIGVADGVVDGVESYEHIRNRKAAVSWGHKGTYEFRLQFDNSRYYDQTHVKYGYVDFSVTIVGEEVIDQTYVPDYNDVKGDMLTTTWKNGRKVSTIVTRKDGSTKFRSTYYNDSNNRIETKTYYDTNNHYTSKYYYNNDANKTIQKSYKYNKPGTSGYYTRYEYTNGVKDRAYKYEAGERVASYTFFKSGSAKGDIQYKYYWETVNGHAIKTRKQEFNTSGHTIKNSYYSNSGKLTKVYKYNKPGTSGYYTRYMYDSNGVKERAYRYENGKQTASYTFFKSGSAKGDIQVKYYWKTVNGHLIKTRRQELNTSGHTIENRYYSDNGKLTKLYKYSKPGTSGYYTRYMYDSNGVKEKSYKYENGNLVNSYSYYKSGSAKGKIKSKYYYHTSHGKTIKDKRVDYDTHGHVTKTTRY